MAQRDDLVAAIAQALADWEEWRKTKSLMTEWPPDQDIFAPVSQAIAACDEFKKAAGKSLFSGYSGVVLAPDALAVPTMYHANGLEAHKAEGGADWLLRVLTTKESAGLFQAVIWGLSVDKEIEIADGVRLIPFAALPDGYMKRRTADRSEEQWNGMVWQSQRYHGLPASALIRHLDRVPYIGSPERPFQILNTMELETRDQLAFLQATAAGAPVVAGSWFEWDDADLDFNRHENFTVWHLPEIVPVVRSHVAVKADDLVGAAGKFGALPGEWQATLLRSMDRFVLSQCRYKIPDQALDLAIAFEIAVGGGSGDNAPPSWKISVRSAQIIGGPLEERQKYRDTLADLYRIRNKTSHGGSIKDADAARYAETIATASEIYRKVVMAALELAAAPDWQLLELQARGS